MTCRCATNARCGRCDEPKPVLLVHDRVCPLCDGWGVRTETIVEYVRSRPCTSCGGTGKVPRVFNDWRPFEPCVENVPPQPCSHLSVSFGGFECFDCGASLEGHE